MANIIIKIAVMGATGTGKSTFVKLLTNDENIHIGHGQESETFDIQTSSYTDQRTSRSIMLIDTPGFDDSRDGVTDADILEKIMQFLEPASGERQKLNGIIYMHRISDPRVGGVSRKNLRMFHSLCGETSLRNVRIVTTNWSRVEEQEGNYREADLKSEAFKALIDAGAQMHRHADTLESAHQIMSDLISLEAVTMRIQEEVRDGKKLEDTAAGQVLAAEMREMEQNHGRKMDDLKTELESVALTNDHIMKAKAEEDRKALEARAARIAADRAELERALENQRREEQARREEERARARQVTMQLEQQRREERARRDRANEIQRQLREEAARKQLALLMQIGETNRRIVELQNDSGSGGGCVIS